MWSEKERDFHIDVLELHAAIPGIESLCQKLRHSHLSIELGNITAVAYINNVGGTHSVASNTITKDIIMVDNDGYNYGCALVTFPAKIILWLIA